MLLPATFTPSQKDAFTEDNLIKIIDLIFLEYFDLIVHGGVKQWNPRTVSNLIKVMRVTISPENFR